MPETSTLTAETSQLPPPTGEIAPAWHTAGVLLLLGGMVVLTLRGHTGSGNNRVVGYGIAFAIEWLIFGFIALGVRWQGASIATLAGRFSLSSRSIARDLGIAIAYLIVAQIVLGASNFALAHILPPASNDAIKNMLPQTVLEKALFLLLALTAGICEETIFRGYLQRQLTAYTGSAVAGIALQGVLFGAAHAYQGVSMMIVISIYGCMFGVLAWWQKSLRPGMFAHFIQDAVGGLVLAKYALK
jgi:membrane protease YdiL (CAAX protease family)